MISGSANRSAAHTDRMGAAVARYVASAALIRCAQGGAAVGLVTLVVSRDGAAGATLGGVLAALLTAPFVLGPWLARWLEGVRDSRRALAGSFLVFGAGLAAGALLFGRAPVAVVVALVAAAGLAVPLMTGGLSSRLADLVEGGETAQRRAEGWDSATYGMSNIVGPGVVAVTTPLAGAPAAVGVLGGIAVLGAALTSTLPRTDAGPGGDAPMPVREAMRVLLTVGPLRRVTVATMLTAVSMGGVMVVAVVLGGELSAVTGAGAALAGAYGVGNLLGSVGPALFPLRGEPEKLTITLIAANAVAVAACSVAPSYPVALGTFVLAGASSAMLFTTTLTVRSVHSPPGARAQVFVTMGSVRMAAASAGTALAGTLVVLGPRVALLVGAAVTASAVVIALLDRNAHPAAPVADDARGPAA